MSAVRPLRYRLRAQIYEFLLICHRRPPFFFVSRSRFHPFTATHPENLRTFSRNPSTFVPKSTAFRRPSPTLRNRLRHARRKPPFLPFSPSLSRAHYAHSAIFRFLPSPFTHPVNPLMHNALGVKIPPPFFLHPALHPPHPSPPRNDHGRKWPKEGEDRARGEAFTHNTLCFKRLDANRREHRQGTIFTHNPLTLNILQAKGEEVKAKNRKTLDARASRVRVGRSPRAGRCPSWAGGEKTPLGAPPSREKIVTSQGAPRPSSRTWGHRPKTPLSEPAFFPFSP